MQCSSYFCVYFFSWNCSLMTPANQYVENFYNNPMPQYGTSCYPQHQSTMCHSHYPSNHAHSMEYQSYHPNNGRMPKHRKCGGNGGQPLLPNPAGFAAGLGPLWAQPNTNNSQPKTNGFHHKCVQQNSQQQLYQCTSECSDHSLKSHCKNSNCKELTEAIENCQKRLQQQQQQQTNNKHHHQHIHSNNCTTTNGNDILNGNDPSRPEPLSKSLGHLSKRQQYENDDETTEHDRMITSASDCCSSAGEVDGDSCCSCSLYAEADEPATTATTPQSSSSNNQLAKVSAQN